MSDKPTTYNFGFRWGQLTDFRDKTDVLSSHIGYTLNRTHGMIQYDGLPETLPKRDLALMLQTGGFVCLPDPGFFDGKLYAFSGELGGPPNPYYMPTICTVANPALKFNRTLKIDEECIIIPHDPLYLGLLPLINRYSTMLTENELSMYIATINSRIISLISCADDKVKEKADLTLRDIIDGKLSVIADSAFFEGIKVQPFSDESKQLTHLIEFEQYLKAGLWNELGLNANYNMKRESINTSEAQMNDDALLPLIDVILDTQRTAFDKFNSKFGDKYGIHITVKLGSAWEDRQQIQDIETQEVEKSVENVESEVTADETE